MDTQPVRPSRTFIQVEDDRTGITKEALGRAFTDHLTFTQMKDEHTATDRDRLFALCYAVRDRLVHRWIQTQKAYYVANPKRVYYLSLEYLMGRALGNNLLNLGLYDMYRRVLADLKVDLDTLRGIVVREVDGAPIRLSDVALVEDGFEDIRRYSRVNGEPVKSQPLEHGDRVQLGRHVVQLVLEKHDAPPRVYVLDET